MKSTLTKHLDALAKLHGEPKLQTVRDPFELILKENVAYLVSDERRAEAFKALKARVGVKPERILAAPQDVLLEIAQLGGMLPKGRVDKLKQAAELAVEQGGDLRAILKEPLAKARRVLKKFLGVGDPGAEKILLFSHTHPFLALESNGLRVLLRLGYGSEKGAYAKQYKSAQEAAGKEIEEACAPRMRAHLLLRLHGQTLCKRSAPECGACPLSKSCPYAAAGG
jgi:endonuclease-3